MSDTTAIVTGYIPIQGHPRTAAEYGEFGEKLFGALDCVAGGFYIQPFYEHVGETWLSKMITGTGLLVTHSEADNPEKNTLAYHMVQHQKFAWLLKAKLAAPPTVRMFVWMDYGIGHVPGVTPAVVQDFMASVKPGDFAIPGCWTKDEARDRGNFLWPNWRFCGGLMVVPAEMVYPLYKAVKDEVRRHMQTTHNVTWEVNSLANAERGRSISPRWYYADHNQTMFTNYGASHDPAV